jgi:hypothetical protein
VEDWVLIKTMRTGTFSIEGVTACDEYYEALRSYQPQPRVVHLVATNESWKLSQDCVTNQKTASWLYLLHAHVTLEVVV